MSEIIMTDTTNMQEFANKYAELAATAGISAAEEYAVSVLGDNPSEDVVEAYRPFVNEAMEARKEEIISNAVQAMVGEMTAENQDGEADGSTGDDSTGTTEQLDIVEDVQEAASEAHSEEQAEDSTQA